MGCYVVGPQSLHGTNLDCFGEGGSPLAMVKNDELFRIINSLTGKNGYAKRYYFPVFKGKRAGNSTEKGETRTLHSPESDS